MQTSSLGFVAKMRDLVQIARYSNENSQFVALSLVDQLKHITIEKMKDES